MKISKTKYRLRKVEKILKQMRKLIRQKGKEQQKNRRKVKHEGNNEDEK